MLTAEQIQAAFKEAPECSPHVVNAIERLLLVTMLHEALAGPPAADSKPGYTVSDVELEKLCAMVQTCLRSAGVPTPEETYESNIRWAVNDLVCAFEAKAQAPQAWTGWHLPKDGDLLKMVKAVDGFLCHEMELLGETVTMQGGMSSLYSSFVKIPAKAPVCGITVKHHNSETFHCIPLECFEPAAKAKI